MGMVNGLRKTGVLDDSGSSAFFYRDGLLTSHEGVPEIFVELCCWLSCSIVDEADSRARNSAMPFYGMA